MFPSFLVSESSIEESGYGESFEIGSQRGMVLLSLGITETVEQQSLDVEILGSVDGEEWLTDPVCSFPQKFYNGVWQILCDLDSVPEIKFLKVGYKVARWGVGSQVPKFKFYVFAEQYGN